MEVLSDISLRNLPFFDFNFNVFPNFNFFPTIYWAPIFSPKKIQKTALIRKILPKRKINVSLAVSGEKPTR